VIKADRNEHANVAAAPEGRLWLMWEQSGTIYAARTNRAASRLGAVNAIRPPSGASIYRLNGEGSAGPLDLIANMQAAGGQALWHTQVWPKLSLTGSRKGATIAFRVTDAGDPVAGAKVKAGGKTLTTNAAGRATLAKAPTGRVQATASKAAYMPATATVR
jgi:hypothetical protein